MFHHIVLMHYSTAADTAFHAEVEAWCERVRQQQPRPERYVYRRNQAARSDGLEHAIVASFASAQAHEQYQASTVHQAMKAYMTPFIDRIVVCDIDEDSL